MPKERIRSVRGASIGLNQTALKSAVLSKNVPENNVTTFPKKLPNKKPHIMVDIPQNKNIFRFCFMFFPKLPNFRRIAHARVNKNPYPASPIIIPKNIKKNGAIIKSGSIPR